MNNLEKDKEIKLSQKEKINALKKKGYPCFEYEFDFKTDIEKFIKDANSGSLVAGRIIKFDHECLTGCVADSSSKLNFSLRRNKKNLELAEFIDEGDIVGLEGELLESNLFCCDRIIILTKTHRPLSGEKSYLHHHNLRHLDYISNDVLRRNIIMRAKVIALLRGYLSKKHFIEIDTPLLHPHQGDSIAVPLFVETTACDMRFSLASSPELYLKKMLVGGFNKVFTINRAFRDECIDDTHLIEFLSIEYYMAYVDYMYMMDFTEEMLKYIAKKIHGKKFLLYKEHKLDFGKKWERISIHESLKGMFKSDLFVLSKSELLKIAKSQGISYDKDVSPGNIVIDIFNKCIGDLIIQPTFVYDYPKDATVMCYDITMAKEKRGNGSILERFELYMGGMELANCYSELNDPEQQKKSFERFLKGRNKTLRMDPNFYHALQVGMPPSGGVGFGIDRLLMILTNSAKIYETIPFSTYHENIRKD